MTAPRELTLPEQLRVRAAAGMPLEWTLTPDGARAIAAVLEAAPRASEVLGKAIAAERAYVEARQRLVAALASHQVARLRAERLERVYLATLGWICALGASLNAYAGLLTLWGLR